MKLFAYSYALLVAVATSQLVAAANLGARASCNADNCARAATGSRGGLQSARFSACSSFQQCTVTPAPSAGGAVITSCPTSLPASVSACSGESRYRSACSCAGFTQVYTTKTSALTSPSPTPTKPAKFRLRVANGAYEGSYVVVDQYQRGVAFASLLVVNEQIASIFSLDAAKKLTFVADPTFNPTISIAAYQPQGTTGSAVYFSNTTGLPYLSCKFVSNSQSPTGEALVCEGNANGQAFYGCEALAADGPNQKYLRLDTQAARYCALSTLFVIAA